MAMIEMSGMDFENATGGIYLWRRDASAAAVGGGGGGTMKDMMGKKIRGWHTGKVVPGDTKTWEQVAAHTGLDFPVVQFDAAALIPGADGNFLAHRASRMLANVRMDGWDGIEDMGDGYEVLPGASVRPVDVLGIVGRDWRGPQNREAFTMIDTLVDDSDAKWLGAGEIAGGRRIYGLAQVAREIIPGGDENERCLPLLFLSNGWDGGQGFRITVAPFRLACTNGMTIPLEGFARSFTARHTKGIKERIFEARRVLELTIGYVTEFEHVADKLITQRVSKVGFTKFLERLVPLPTDDQKKAADDGGVKLEVTAEALRAAIRLQHDTSENLGNVRDTAWGVINAVAEHQQWTVQPKVKNETRKGELGLLRAVGDNDLINRAYAVLTD